MKPLTIINHFHNSLRKSYFVVFKILFFRFKRIKGWNSRERELVLQVKPNGAQLILSIFVNLDMFRGDHVPIIGRNNCVYVTLGACYCVWMAVWCTGKEGKVKCTVVQALRLCTGRTAHRNSRGIAVLYRH